MSRPQRIVAAGVIGVVLAVALGILLAHHFRSHSPSTPATTGSGTNGTTHSSGALVGTIKVHVYGRRGGPHPKTFDWTEEPLLLTRIESGEEMTSGAIETAEHTLHVPVGEFTIVVPGSPPEHGLSASGEKVKITHHQIVNVSITVPFKSGSPK